MPNTYIYDKAKDCVIGPVDEQTVNNISSQYYGNLWLTEYLASLPSYPVHPSLKLKEGKVIEGVDFVLGYISPVIETEEEYQQAVYEARHELPNRQQKIAMPCTVPVQPAEAGKGEADPDKLAKGWASGYEEDQADTARQSFIAGYVAAVATTPASQQLTKEEVERMVQKEVQEIKDYIKKKRAEALKNHGTNTALLVFIEKLEEAFTWVRKV